MLRPSIIDVFEVGRRGDPVVVLLHGTPSPHTDWMPVAALLAERYHVLVPALPGYGGSDDPNDASIDAVGDAVAAEIAKRAGREVHAIAGFSSGAYRAFDLVLREQLFTDRVVGLGAMAHFDDAERALRRDFARQLALDPGFLETAGTRAMLLGLMLSPAWSATHPVEAETVAAWPRATTRPGALIRELEALTASRDLRPELPRIRARVSLRVGELDVASPPAKSVEIAVRAPCAEVTIVPGCGHALLVEDCGATGAWIAATLER